MRYSRRPAPGVEAGARTYRELEACASATPGIEFVALRYGFFYGPGTWYTREGDLVTRYGSSRFRSLERSRASTDVTLERASVAPPRPARCDASLRARRHLRQERPEPLRHRGVRENSIAQRRIRQFGQHRRLHRGHDLAGLGSDHREADDAIVTSTDESFHEALRLTDRLRPEHGADRQPRDAHVDALTLRLGFAQPHAGERRVREHAVRNKPVARAARASG